MKQAPKLAVLIDVARFILLLWLSELRKSEVIHSLAEAKIHGHSPLEAILAPLLGLASRRG